MLSFGLAPFLGENFFPSVDSGQILMHVRAQPGTRIEETARLSNKSSRPCRATIPPSQLDNIVDNIGLPYQRHQHGLSEHRAPSAPKTAMP